MGLVKTMSSLDRRIIFLVVALAVIIPLLLPIGLPIKPTAPVKAFYDSTELIPEGSYVLISFDYDPATMPELQPMAISLLYHCFSKKLKVVMIALWPQGPQMADLAMEVVNQQLQAEGKPLPEYGKDYVNLGYKSGGGLVIIGLATNFGAIFPLDTNGTRISELPLMDQVKSAHDLQAVFSLSAGDPGIPAWVMVSRMAGYPTPPQPGETDITGKMLLLGGATAVSAPQFYPYLNTNQMQGLLGGMRGAADYETLLALPGTASEGMDPQSIAHLVIVVFIIMANIFFFLEKRQEERKAT